MHQLHLFFLLFHDILCWPETLPLCISENSVTQNWHTCCHSLIQNVALLYAPTSPELTWRPSPDLAPHFPLCQPHYPRRSGPLAVLQPLQDP